MELDQNHDVKYKIKGGKKVVIKLGRVCSSNFTESPYLVEYVYNDIII
jgi:hypothetical protein